MGLFIGASIQIVAEVIDLLLAQTPVFALVYHPDFSHNRTYKNNTLQHDNGNYRSFETTHNKTCLRR